MTILKKALGPEHPKVATTLNNLGVFYENEGKHRKAEKFFHQSLAISRKAYGLNHPEVEASRTNLSRLYTSQGKRRQASKMEAQASAIRARLSTAYVAQ